MQALKKLVDIISSAFLKRKSLGLLFLFLCGGNIAFSQNSDAGTWVAFAVSKEINDKIEVKIVEEMRTTYNYMFSELNSDLCADYEITSDLSFGVGYRFSNEYDPESGFEKAHRNTFDLGYEFKLGNFDIGYRLRYQLSYNKYEPNKNLIRNKAEVQYAFMGTPYRIGASSELYNEIDAYGFHFPSKLRMSGGVKYYITSKLVSELYYLYQKQVLVANPEIMHVLGLQLSYKLD